MFPLVLHAIARTIVWNWLHPGLNYLCGCPEHGHPTGEAEITLSEPSTNLATQVVHNQPHRRGDLDLWQTDPALRTLATVTGATLVSGR